MDKLIDIQKKLNEFSFKKVIEKPQYTGQSWEDRESFISCNKGCCTSCEKHGHAKPDSEAYDGYQLKYVSHGAHALDFCESMKDVSPDDSWNDTPVLFLFENPSLDYGKLYGAAIEECYDKRPAQMWYWLHEGFKEEDLLLYPKYYRQGCYGGLVASLIKTFRLGNAYMTNFVKCAMNDAEGKRYLGTAEYDNECIATCFKKILYREVEILTDGFDRDIVVFAFSQRVYDLAQQYFGGVQDLQGKYTLCLMPHPASRLANEYRKYVIFGKVYKTLTNCGINCQAALEEFLSHDRSTNVVYLRFGEEHRKELMAQFNGKIDRINTARISGAGTGTITVTPTKIKCRFKLAGCKLDDGIYEFGFNSKEGGAFWIWDDNKHEFRDTAEEVSTQFAELFHIFRDYVIGLDRGNERNV